MNIASFCVAAALAVAVANAAIVRLCVPAQGMEPCTNMLREPSLADLSVQCVVGPDTYGCLKKVAAKEADVAMATGEDVFLARELYDLQIQLVAETRDTARQNEPWRYEGVAVVRRNKIARLSDLRGSKSCHTGYERTAGWNIPFSALLENRLIEMDCKTDATVVEHDMKAASTFFGLACIPGKWAPDNETDTKLKQQYSNLCAICGLPEVCGSEDTHSGYTGALQCLVESHGDVAWTKLSAVQEFFKEKREQVALSDYGLLCPDDRVLDLTASPKRCNWASRPWNGWLVRSSNENKKGILAALTRMMDASSSPGQEGAGGSVRPWAEFVLGISKPSVIHVRSPPVSTRDYLKEHKYDTTIERLGCPEKPVKLCVDSQPSLEKCQALGHVLKSRRIRPKLSCVIAVAPEDCPSMVASGAAHITTADGGDIYRAFLEHTLVPVVSERYGLLDASYFVVAVVRADSGITSLSQLRGKKSCHTGIGRTAGWKIPVMTLLEAGLLDKDDCDFAGQMGHFFSSSCVPGAKDPRFDPKGTNPQSLCALCVGNSLAGTSRPTEGRCDRGPIEAYSGYTGALRCLVEGGGNVAFVKHSTFGEITNTSWGAHLRATDFKLLCRNTGAADVVDYNTCHLARVPAHKVLISPKLNPVMQEEVKILLLRASKELPKGQDEFHMFGTFEGRQDLIFKDSASELVDVRMDTFHTSLEDAYYRTLSKMETCEPKGTTLQYVDSAGMLSTPLHLLLCAALTWLFTY